MLLDYFFLKNKWNIKPTGVIHIGANEGQEIHTYYKDSDINQIVFFEPSLSTFQVLRKNLQEIKMPPSIKQITAHPVGLGPEEKEVDFFVASNGQSSSVLKPQLHTTQHPDITFNNMERIKIKTLDSFNFTGYNFINMDVQGYELEVLKGSVNTLKEIKWIYTEINRAPLYEGCAMVEELDTFLLNFGFRRQDTDWGGDTWGDALFVKE